VPKKNDSPSSERLLGKNQKRFLALLGEGPKFRHELEEISNIAQTYRSLKHIGCKIEKYRYIARGPRKRKTKNPLSKFAIYYYEKDRLEAYNRIKEMYPNVFKTTDHWVTVARPILGEMVIHSKGPGGGKTIKTVPKQRLDA
jgi:hypothetical protein